MPDPISSPWLLQATDFPETGDLAEKLRFFIAYAILAPSGHNTQPWLFRLADNVIYLYADRTRALPVADPDDRELTMSCGAALYNLAIAIRHFGYQASVALLPDPGDPDWVARIQVNTDDQVKPEEDDLFWALPSRRTNRQSYTTQPVPAALSKALQAATEAEGAWLHMVQGDDRRHAVADLIAEADRIQWSDKRFRRELAAWLHPERSRSQDGIPGYTFGVAEVVAYVGPFLFRTFDWGQGQAAKDRQLAAGSPLLAVLGTDSDTPRAWMDAGQALQHVLLQACAAGVSASYLNQPIEVAELRPRLRDLLGVTGFPQLLLRMGYGPDLKPTPRRPLHDVIR